MIAQPALPPGFTLVAFETVESTNDEAKRLAEAGAPELTLVWAVAQSRGRGRGGRSWTSPAGNCYSSLLLRPGVQVQVAAQLSFVAALAVADTVESLLPKGPRVTCKWPNDVLLDGAKCAGILLESRPRPDGQLEWLVLGTGINLASHPEGTEYPATSLSRAGAVVAVETALAAYAAHLDGWIRRWQSAGFGPVRARWLARSDSLGRAVRVRLPEGIIEGVFAELDQSGGLVLALPGGGRRLITAGDVFPAPAAC